MCEQFAPAHSPLNIIALFSNAGTFRRVFAFKKKRHTFLYTKHCGINTHNKNQPTPNKWKVLLRDSTARQTLAWKLGKNTGDSCSDPCRKFVYFLPSIGILNCLERPSPTRRKSVSMNEKAKKKKRNTWFEEKNNQDSSFFDPWLWFLTS